MAAIISILIVLTCIVLVLAVLIQNPKGGGLASGFSTGSQVMGVRRTADFLEKATWTLAVMLFIFSIATTAVGKGSGGAETSQTKEGAAAAAAKANNPAPNSGGAGLPQNFGGGNPGAPAAPAAPPAKP